MKKKILGIALGLILMLSISVLAADQNVVEIAGGSEDYSILVSALEKADLIDALGGDGPYTVFAPNNAAFEKLFKELDIREEDLLAHPQLGDILKYHVLTGKVLSTDLTDKMEADTLKGDKVTVDLSDGVRINESIVTIPDLDATNGVIHEVDTVLIPSDFKLVAEEKSTSEKPQTVVDIALSNEDFSILVSALQKADLVSALQAEGPFTVFAPTNKAFEDLLSTLNISASDLLNQPDLSKVLLQHVVAGKVMSTDLTDGLEAETLNGEMIIFDLSSGVMVSGSNVTSPDLEAENGVVHVIDKVLVPANFKLQTVTEDNAMPKTGLIDLSVIIAISTLILITAFFIKRKLYQ